MKPNSIGAKRRSPATGSPKGERSEANTAHALYIGLDVHKAKTSVATADPGPKGEVRLHGEVATTQVALDRLIRRLAKARGISVSRISVCYEAGGCGMWIARMLMKMWSTAPKAARQRFKERVREPERSGDRLPGGQPREG